MNPSDVFIYICPDDRTEGSDSRICRYALLFLAETGQAYDVSPSILRPPAGRPIFKESGLPFFSVSHSGNLWACAISSRRVGLDIQRVTPERNISAVTHRFFHPDEIAFLEQNGYKGFFSVWAAKESYVKYTGEGIGGGFSGFSVVESSLLSDSINGLRLCRIEIDTAYVMYICYDGIDEACIRVIEETNTDI